MRGEFDGGALVGQKVKTLRNIVVAQAEPRLFREVIGRFEVDVMGRDERFARPTLFDDGDEVFGNVEAKAVIPAVVKPPREFLRRVVFQNIDVQLAVFRQPGEGQVAAAQKAGDGVVEVVPKK